MSKLELSLAFSVNERTKPVIDGTITPQGITFYPTSLHPSELFWRQLEFAEFDVSEMSLSSLLILIANGNKDWVGIPIFTSRRFFHTGVFIRKDAGIEHPKDLNGKRVGVPEYQQTAALWGRGVLKDEFGVDPKQIDWYMERPPEKSHGGATGFTPPEGVQMNYIPQKENIGTMLVSGQLDAVLHYIPAKNLVDRSKIDLKKEESIKHLFEDPRQEGIRYFQKTGMFPINHGVVIRRSLVEKYPWVTLNIYNAFQEAKELARKQLYKSMEPYRQVGLLPDEIGVHLGKDLFPYGVKANRKTLESVTEYSFDQGLTPRRVSIEEIFAPNTLEL